MKFVLKIMSIAMALCSAQACRSGSCNAFCAGEIRDPTKKLTFYSMDALDAFNQNFNGDEQFSYLSDGKCTYDNDCNAAKESKICATPELEASGFPKTFRNFCDLNQFNSDNPDNEYLYYHDDSCNELVYATPSEEECECLECNDLWQPVCAYPSDPNGAQPVTLSSYCWLQNFNCENHCEYWYWHEDACYTDDKFFGDHFEFDDGYHNYNYFDEIE